MSECEVADEEPDCTLDEALAAIRAWRVEEHPRRRTGTARKRIVDLVGPAYKLGATIRDMHEAMGWSFGLARDLVAESDATLSPEGFRDPAVRRKATALCHPAKVRRSS